MCWPDEVLFGQLAVLSFFCYICESQHVSAADLQHRLVDSGGCWVYEVKVRIVIER